VNAFWAYFWPIFGAGLTIGVATGLAAFRAPRARPKDREAAIQRWRRRRRIVLLCGAALVLAAAGLWQGPLGAADRLAAQVERDARLTLDNYEMTQVRARIHHGPFTRQLLLSGSADDFQRSELVRIVGSIPGVSSATWSAAGGGTPLIAEGAGTSLLGFLIGLVLAYLVELRRRYNAQWNW
jgi:hypothetical protein